MTSDLDVTVEIKVEAYIDGVKQTAALLWDLQANSVQYYGADSAYHAKETVKAFPAGVGSHNFMQIVVDWENTKTVRMRANDTVIGVDAAHHSVAAAGEADRIKVFIGYTNLEAVSHVGYFDDFVYTYDEPVI